MKTDNPVVLACLVAGLFFGVPAVVGGSLNETSKAALAQTLEVTEPALIRADTACDDLNPG